MSEDVVETLRFCIYSEYFPMMCVHGGFYDAAHNRIEARRVAAAGENTDPLNSFHAWSLAYPRPFYQKVCRPNRRQRLWNRLTRRLSV